MTSKNLFFKLVMEDLKRRIWAVCLAFLGFFFWMPAMAAMNLSRLARQVEEWKISGLPSQTMSLEELRMERILGLVRDILGMRNYAVPFLLVGAAVVLGITGFSWLHSRKRVDFYHSIPVRRELLFLVKYLDGILIVFSMYLLNLLLCCGIFSIHGAGAGQTLIPGLVSMLVHLVNFILIYSVTAAAVIMTGNFFISILGMLVFFTYVPLIGVLLQGMSYMFFSTILDSSQVLTFLIKHGSPVGYYIQMIADGSRLEPAQYGLLMPGLLLPFFIALLLTVFCLFLYRLRPSEAAGKAMAFSVSRAPIKILIVTPVTIAMGVLFWNIYESIGWAAFGFLFGLAVTHCTMEILYHFDFRKLFSNLPHAGICAVLALAVIGVYRYDLVGYDRYFPSEETFDSAAVYVSILENWGNASYGIPVKTDDGMDWKYISEKEFAENNMELRDYAGLKVIAEYGIQEAERSREQKFGGSQAAGSGEGSQALQSYITVTYRLKNGRNVNRRYWVSMEALKDELNQVYMQKEYKEGTFPVLSYNDSDLYRVYMYKNGKIRPAAGQEMTAEILAAYREDMQNLTLEERCRETPVCALRFLTSAEKEYLTYVSAGRRQSSTGTFSLEDMQEVNFFPVYPSFSGTIRALQEAGTDPLAGLSVDDISHIIIEAEILEPETEVYGETMDAEYSWSAERKQFPIANDSPENRELIQEILDSSREWNLILYNGIQTYENEVVLNIYLTQPEDSGLTDGEEYIQYLFVGDKVPESVRERIGYDGSAVQSVHQGLSSLWGD